MRNSAARILRIGHFQVQSRSRPYGFVVCALLTGLLAGCAKEGTIEVDLTTRPPRFIVDHVGWPRPFKCPVITEVAIASDEDEELWHIESLRPEGLPARQLGIIYGQVPAGFNQTIPAMNEKPKQLVTGRTYFLAAGGPDHVYKVAFALPIDDFGPIIRPPTTQPVTTRPVPTASP